MDQYQVESLSLFLLLFGGLFSLFLKTGQYNDRVIYYHAISVVKSTKNI